MNGYTILADTYRKHGQNRKALLMDFLSTCTDEDLCTLFDSAAFNQITMSYVRTAVKELIQEEVIDEEQGTSIRNRVSLLFDEKTAKEIWK